jgi:hypothetical protein
MHIEHCGFLSWFSASPESHEQDGEKLSRVAAGSGRQQRLAILPWRFEPCSHRKRRTLPALACHRRRVSPPDQISERIKCIRFG